MNQIQSVFQHRLIQTRVICSICEEKTCVRKNLNCAGEDERTPCPPPRQEEESKTPGALTPGALTPGAQT